jgi:hypothetical protein
MRDCCRLAAVAQALVLRGRAGERITGARTGLERSGGNQGGIGKRMRVDELS